MVVSLCLFPRNPSLNHGLGESRSHAVRRHKSLEKSLYSRGVFDQYHVVMEEYFEKEHAELVPPNDLKKPASEVFYLPLHVVFKDSSTTTKVRAVFDASAPSTSGVSLNNLLLVGPTVHSSLVDVLIRFRLHRIALTTDVSRMYRMVLLEESDKDLHRFVWKRGPFEPLRDYRMTRVTFGVAASSYAANMAIKQNAEDFASEFPTAAKVVEEAFYVDDGLTGADSPEEAIYLQQELQQLFACGGFTLRKWNCSNPTVLKSIPEELRDPRPQCTLPSDSEYTKTLGVEWNTVLDHFRLKIAKLPPVDNITKRFLVSDVARTFDVLGWYSPCTIVMKILFQQLWEMKVDWDEVVPEPVRDSWLRWRSELDLLSTKHIPRCYHDKCTSVVSMELHGFSDASERAYAAVIYLRMECTDGRTQIALITSKTKVAPIKRLTIPRLELCGAKLLAQLMHHVRIVLDVPLIAVMHGLTAPSCYTGFEGVQDGSRPMSAIGFLTSSSYLDRSAGIMYAVWSIQQIVPHVVCIRQSSSSMSCGGKAQTGSNFHHHHGQISQSLNLNLLLRRRRKFVSLQ